MIKKYLLFALIFITNSLHLNAQTWTKKIELNSKIQKIKKSKFYIEKVINNTGNNFVLGEFLNKDSTKFTVYYKGNFEEKSLEICRKIAPRKNKLPKFILKIDSFSLLPELTKNNILVHKSYISVEFINNANNQHFYFGKIEKEHNIYGSYLDNVLAKTLSLSLQDFNKILNEKTHEMVEITEPFELNKGISFPILNHNIKNGIYETFQQLIKGEPSINEKVNYKKSKTDSSIYILKDYSFEESLSINAFVADSALFIKLGNIKNKNAIKQSGFIKSKLFGRFCYFETDINNLKNYPKVYKGADAGSAIGNAIGGPIGDIVASSIGAASDLNKAIKENSILDIPINGNPKGLTSFFMDGMTGEIRILNDINIRMLLHNLDKKLLVEFIRGDKSKSGQIELIKKINSKFN